MKKTTAILVILLTSIILLAHAVVPHMHFNNEVFVVPKCHIEGENHHHGTTSENHNDSNSTDYCILKQILLVPLNNSRADFKCPVYIDQNNSFDSYHTAVLLDSGFEFYAPLPLTILSPPNNSIFYSQFLPGGIASRAPPVV